MPEMQPPVGLQHGNRLCFLVDALEKMGAPSELCLMLKQTHLHLLHVYVYW